ncbi:universal stress protein [Rhodoferax sp.]|uniref:universal stress protein n=1 Tax=Rhodoferax sp. TaxID=50421 RepID=UPI002742FD63|nr:universal stress protein [Rhodoferax sp.]
MHDYRNILVSVSDGDQSGRVLSCAAKVAGAHDATLCAIHAPAPLHLGAYLNSETAMIAAQLRRDAEQTRTATARDRVHDAARTSGLSIDFHHAPGDPLQAMVARARVADLIVVGQPCDDDVDGWSRRVASQLLVAAACPVLFVPHSGGVDSCAARVLVAWSATRESARALKDALPILRRAQAVEVLCFGDAAPGDSAPLDGLAAFLQAHEVSATFSVRPVRTASVSERMLTPTVVDASITELLLSHAADMAADLLVMGGYGHTRLHELVLGGVTRTMLGSMTVPVLMSH